ncbi:hypothetical protein [Actinomadura sp. WMMB 499]|uniref:hypothetical protein n=1 Tax=Actinomadura sp. WMMB 499 TaxID=1219491 RepID=UPI001247E725|nr:hypothetical protein [Actinomadura sp. WMMB 499]QFG24139.1 hypothetical protein F7P10_26465 [Actinomadura sp. WMMB 499]
MNDDPLVNPGDRFPLGLPGHAVPVSAAPRSATERPWGMDCAVVPAPVRAMGKHGKPTSTKSVPKATTYTDDSVTRKDTVTETVTD